MLKEVDIVVWVVTMVVLGYLMGSIPTGIIIGKKVKGIDLREVGSGNIGTANAIRALGVFWGMVVFLGDVLKGTLPTLAALYLHKFVSIPASFQVIFPLLVGFSAILGHNYSAFLKFSGGKGIATSFGVFLALDYRVALVGLLIWIISVAITKYSSLGSLLGALSLPFLLWAFKHPWEYVVFGFVSASLAFYKHRENIKRLLKGEERKITDKVGKT